MTKRYPILLGVPDAADDPLPVAPGTRADHHRFERADDRGRLRRAPRLIPDSGKYQGKSRLSELIPLPILEE
ncbi:hypothetical protein [Nocardia acidivorans]|uniref:hypothetical protein n=1 Tax=Nocardia acidivorans TaxID=404580 RepID=UPI000831B8A6|nr:hypothetical protein [Nocardia acidivorans]